MAPSVFLWRGSMTPIELQDFFAELRSTLPDDAENEVIKNLLSRADVKQTALLIMNQQFYWNRCGELLTLEKLLELRQKIKLSHHEMQFALQLAAAFQNMTPIPLCLATESGEDFL